MKRLLVELSWVLVGFAAAFAFVAAVMSASGCSADGWEAVGRTTRATTQAVGAVTATGAQRALPFGDALAGLVTLVATGVGAFAEVQRRRHREDHVARERLEAENAELRKRLERPPAAVEVVKEVAAKKGRN